MGFQRGNDGLFYNVKCDDCGTRLVSENEPWNVVHNNAPGVYVNGEPFNVGWKYLQAREALEIHMIGYYGGFTDSMSQQDQDNLTILLCKACAIELVETKPYFLKALMKVGVHGGIGHSCILENRDIVWQPYFDCEPCRAATANAALTAQAQKAQKASP